mmetsp:Transcript_48118/g.93979  ORF Transcript_48118/g.93979 Transcript_48118/m.93979 type:complete len:100 (-) Transcript_48118:342-641(-)
MHHHRGKNDPGHNFIAHPNRNAPIFCSLTMIKSAAQELRSVVSAVALGVTSPAVGGRVREMVLCPAPFMTRSVSAPVKPRAHHMILSISLSERHGPTSP